MLNPDNTQHSARQFHPPMIVIWLRRAIYALWCVMKIVMHVHVFCFDLKNFISLHTQAEWPSVSYIVIPWAKRELRECIYRDHQLPGLLNSVFLLPSGLDTSTSNWMGLPQAGLWWAVQHFIISATLHPKRSFSIFCLSSKFWVRSWWFRRYWLRSIFNSSSFAWSSS
jgi:hypothetical protein